MSILFKDLAFPTPTADGLAAAFGRVTALLDAGQRDQALALFDTERRAYDSWASLVALRFAQDTTDPQARADRDLADSLTPRVTEHEIAIKRRLLDDPDRPGLVAAVGTHTVRLWETDITTFDPRIRDALEEEARLGAEYTALLASARLTVDGQTVNLSGLAPFAESLDRDVRHAAEQARWDFFATHGTELDALYDRLVQVRHGMARTLGYDTYTPLGYRRMRRVDYGPAEVARFRDDVLTHVVPLVRAIMENRRLTMNWDRLRSWDEALIDPLGNPRPAGDHDVLVERAQTMFDRMGGDLGAFYRKMTEGGFLDVRNRPTKAGGGFCTAFPSMGMPFIFANFNGTQHDINVFTHEMGHAYQNWKSRDLPGIDLLWPTMEAAEINSMALEFLTWPQIDLMVEDGLADRFRRVHLIGSLSFLPYGVCVDHFQHEVYARPDMTAEQRHATWRRLEQLYMPWRDYGDLARPAMGGRWQAQGHIYRSPFYYIDYTLALCCAMQFWLRSRTDQDGAMAVYTDLCTLGGSQPFTGLVAAAGLASPFEPGTLADIVQEAERVLQMR
ncbi:M3 family oligoendopeptidase [Gluconacetobacter diazotrophicus]|uniref:Oligoendopeptidase F n=1 Tax=Gluconacetobacter diazotrophicus (strain ATCC 49037 / DSM 5601 / CCUG 37298 / CIP 103539 / LMG 7603 / PAl5) TaxID=272568 RepID=A9HSA2_GLUDA|nr:M3 family oligoendopeptidase [Gluconacetobacter diazotrophicus]CAP57049.1 Oligoendopeptidase F [Gluconacetobacter diazotrophicus PA1 5]